MKKEPRSFLPDPADLRWLVRSLDLRSFSAAAREMDVAVSVVARGVDRLEAGYGVRLLRRSTHGLSATPEGAELAQEARALLAQLEDIGASLSDQRSRVAGSLRLASSQEICEALVLPHLADLQARYPALRVELLADDRVADLVTEGIDVALRTTVGHSDLVVARALGRFERRLYAAPEYLRQHGTPADPSELQQHHTVTHTAQGPAVTWAFRAAQGKPLEVTVRSRLAASSSALVHHALVSGAGIGMLSSPLAAADVAQGRLVEVLAPFASRTVHTLYAVSSPDRRNAARVKAVIDFLVKASKDRWALAPVR
ncbi:LysR family transcriptional regulator [Acidovorax sp. Root275]|uniref:LysR family transcriptional regulator n=1 Tax=Acidovorax sp. Root275 TaxID=1736508 RepID=UPI00070CDF54|nr:LysR family transcriptional regulator [Acidovorax sp. Root275]KRD56217.1 LysR family transcriptional regulator [Acidovorax sp. Root275]